MRYLGKHENIVTLEDLFCNDVRDSYIYIQVSHFWLFRGFLMENTHYISSEYRREGTCIARIKTVGLFCCSIIERLPALDDHQV